MLYRGECLQTHEKNQGEIRPKGDRSEVSPLYDGSITHDGRFTYGESALNAVRAHHLESGKWRGCWISTTRSYELAKHFATCGNFCDGVIYIIDDSLFDSAGVVAFEDEDPHYPHEREVSIRAADGGTIPPSVIVGVNQVKPC